MSRSKSETRIDLTSQSTDEEDGCDGVTREGSAMDVDLSQPEPARTSRSSRVRDMPLPPPLARPASVADIRSTGHNLFSPSASHDRGPRTRDPSLVKAVTTMSRSEQPFMQRETPPSHPASTNKTASSSRRFSTSSQSQPQDWSKGKQRATEPTLVGHANVTSNEDNEDSEDNMAVDEPEAPREHVLSKSDSTKIPPMQKWPHIQAMPTADKRNLTKAPASTSSRPFYHPVRDPSPVKFSTASLRGVHSPAEPSRPSPSPIQTQTTASSASYRPACTPSSQYASGPRALGMLGVRGRSSRLHQPFKAPRPSQASQQTLQRDVPTHMFSEPTRTQSRIAGVLTTTSGPSRTASAESSWGETPFSNTGSSITNSGKRVSSAPASGLFASEPPVSEVEDDGAVSEGYSREEHYSYSHEKRNDEDVSRQARPPQAPVSRRSLSPEATLEADSSYGDIMPEFDLQTINMIMQPYDCVKA
ncbi:uncharacterized protein PHACADRAFT_259323 [Phanerochaete carnosa HHB-10118-sp]|uniref:Uncharacterized protein n=1 Tax=Phanerochaete carnosa (strain HHB-10118-sp) TaxID=650164 RepID=K5WRW7_PHACS|nr:uncharacterized protein PHACADRAFT_259323 [Phanerochaete carnosa HHB-10118-sp]EKM53137.1 hypothetical protein PHACADRAFT_259323 [Phanerochaete carnosa HHB-10118-sp]